MNKFNLPPKDIEPPIPTPPATIKAPFVLAVEANKLVKFRIPVDGFNTRLDIYRLHAVHF